MINRVVLTAAKDANAQGIAAQKGTLGRLEPICYGPGVPRGPQGTPGAAGPGSPSAHSFPRNRNQNLYKSSSLGSLNAAQESSRRHREI